MPSLREPSSHRDAAGGAEPPPRSPVDRLMQGREHRECQSCGSAWDAGATGWVAFEASGGGMDAGAFALCARCAAEF